MSRSFTSLFEKEAETMQWVVPEDERIKTDLIVAKIESTDNPMIDIPWTYIRVKAFQTIAKLAIKDDWGAAHELANLLGYKSYNALINDQRNNPSINKTCEMLSGPHGYAIYKALKAKQVVETQQSNVEVEIRGPSK